MDKSILGNKSPLSLTGVTKKVPSASTAAPTGKASTPASFAPDALVRTGSAQPATNAPSDASRAAELMLASCYHPDRAQFAKNVARAQLEQIVNTLG